MYENIYLFGHKDFSTYKTEKPLLFLGDLWVQLSVSQPINKEFEFQPTKLLSFLKI